MAVATWNLKIMKNISDLSSVGLAVSVDASGSVADLQSFDHSSLTILLGSFIGMIAYLKPGK